MAVDIYCFLSLLMQKIVGWLIFSLLLISCSNESRRNNKAGTSDEPFQEFYDRFHEDSLFQLARIVFPLAGFDNERHLATPDKDSITVLGGENVNVYWQKKGWNMQRILFDTTRFHIKKVDLDS